MQVGGVQSESTNIIYYVIMLWSDVVQTTKNSGIVMKQLMKQLGTSN